MTDRGDAFARLLAVWNGEAALDTLDALMAPNYRGHIGLRDRDLARLKRDIGDFLNHQPGARFQIEHQFGDGVHLATRLTAQIAAVAGGVPSTVCGLNISRWDDGLLAEEWAVWEPFGDD